MKTNLPKITLALLCASLLPATAAKPAFDPAQGKDIVSLRIIHKGDTANLLKTGKRWFTAGNKLPVEKAKIEDAISILLALQPVPVAYKPGDSAALANFALRGPEARQVEWKTKSGKVSRAILGRMLDPLTPEQYAAMEIHVGDTASGEHGWVYLPETDSTYWSLPEKDAVYSTPGNYVRLSPNQSDWLDLTLLPPFLYQQVQAVEVNWRDSTGKDHHYKLKRTSDTSAALVKPYAAPVPRENAAEIFLQTPQFVVEEFVGEAESKAAAAEYAKPWVQVRVTMKDGKTHVVKAGKSHGKFHYALHPSEKRPVKIAKWRFDFFRKTVSEILTPLPQSTEAHEEEPEEAQAEPPIAQPPVKSHHGHKH